MSAQCSNCKATLSCGCQRRVASNGTSVCTGCLGKYEASIKVVKQVITPKNISTSPTNVHVIYDGKWKNIKDL